MKTHICPACGGDGIERCNNPDHGLINSLSFHDVGRIGCPCCGHDPYYRIGKHIDGRKVFNYCPECEGSGKVTLSECESILIEWNIDSPSEDYIAALNKALD
jgi:hypothetical protein